MSELRHQQIEPSSLEFFGKVNILIPFPFPPYILIPYVLGAAVARPLLCSSVAIAASLPNPSFVFAHDRRRRASSAHSHTTHSHVVVDTCQAAQRSFGCRAACKHFFPPPPSRERADQQVFVSPARWDRLGRSTDAGRSTDRSPDPRSNHSQQRRRRECPPTRNE